MTLTITFDFHYRNQTPKHLTEKNNVSSTKCQRLNNPTAHAVKHTKTKQPLKPVYKDSKG
jgi:hypothetical protein